MRTSDHTFRLCEPDPYCRRWMTMPTAELEYAANAKKPSCAAESAMNESAHKQCVSTSGGGAGSGAGAIIGGGEFGGPFCHGTRNQCPQRLREWEGVTSAARLVLELRQKTADYSDDDLRKMLKERDAPCANDATPLACQVQRETYSEGRYRARALLEARAKDRAAPRVN
jgi:hypothetical protein